MNHNENKATSTAITIKGILSLLMESVGESKRVISLGMGDPTLSTFFPNTKVAEQAVADTLHSGKFHGYAPTPGLLQARK
jgi:tyrosine aminotransferase